MKNQISRVSILVVVCAIACFGAGLSTSVLASGASQNDERLKPMAAENVQRGQKLFEANCAFCHGATAKGGATGPSLMDSSLVRHDKDGDLIGKVVREGRLDKGMPSFTSFNAEQVSDLVAFLHARILVTDSVETAGPAGGYQLKRLLTGNAEEGKAFFQGAGGCAKCHSATGDLAGLAKKYHPAELESRFLYPPQRKSASVTLSSGATVEGTLVHLDSFYIAIVAANGQYHSWTLPGPTVTVQDPLREHTLLLAKYTDKDMHNVFAYLETLK